MTKAGLKSDPYAIASECWVAEPEWSDMFMFMIVIPLDTYLAVSVYDTSLNYCVCSAAGVEGDG